MAQLSIPTATDLVELLGYTIPRDYEAGVMDNGTKFEAGKSMKLCAGTTDDDGAPDFYVFKVKSADVDAVFKVVDGMQRGEDLIVHHYDRRGIRYVTRCERV